jgi:uncharacterized protein YqiB (DUF1249 family)
MLVKDKNPAAFAPRPHSFSDLMEMYEANYIRLRLLCGDIRAMPRETVSRLDGGVPVHIQVLERATHTTTLMLTYLFDNGSEDYDRRPDLQVRVYHDSRQAEVISRRCALTGKVQRSWDHNTDSLLLCRWRLNRFLFKWAGYLHRQGHSFK